MTSQSIIWKLFARCLGEQKALADIRAHGAVHCNAELSNTWSLGHLSIQAKAVLGLLVARIYGNGKSVQTKVNLTNIFKIKSQPVYPSKI